MMIARWSIDAKFGYKQNAIELMQRWAREIGPQAGLTLENSRLLTGSVGALEATLQSEVRIKDLAELDAAWARLATIPAHRDWSKQLEPFVVSGTSRWEIFRVLDL